MKRVIRPSLLFSSLCFFASTTYGQTTSAAGQQEGMPSSAPKSFCSASFGPISGVVVPVTTAPYSAVQESSTVQTLADGTHISHKPAIQKIYRDSQGRTR